MVPTTDYLWFFPLQNHTQDHLHLYYCTCPSLTILPTTLETNPIDSLCLKYSGSGYFSVLDISFLGLLTFALGSIPRVFLVNPT